MIFKYSIILWIALVILAIVIEFIKDIKIDARLNYTHTLTQEINKIHGMDGFEFEQYCAYLLRKIGYRNVVVTPKSNDKGRDIICTDKKGMKVFVECKHYREDRLINREQILKLAGSMAIYGADRCLFITTSGFNKNAIEVGKHKRVELWDMNDVIRVIKGIELL